MVNCSFCDEEFDSEKELHRHWDEHRDELNSHQKDKVKKAKRKHEEEKEKKMAKRKAYAGYGLVAVLAIGLIGVVGAQLIQGNGGGSTSAGEIDISDDPVVGNESATVTIVEYGDYQCPVCGQFHNTVYQRLKEDYIDTGKAKFVWKDFPLSQIHPWANQAARGMECVQRQDVEAYSNVKDQLFQNQDSLDTSNVRSQIISWAEDEGVEGSDIRSCLNSGNPQSEVQKDYREGVNDGVQGTPTVFVNGQRVNWQDYNAVSNVIDSELDEN